MKKSFIALIIFFISFSIGDITHARKATAPGISLQNTKGKMVMLSQLLQRSHCIIAFWSTYCVPCQRELPELCKIEKKYGASKKVKLLLVSVDEMEKKDTVISTLKEWDINHDSLLDIYQMAAKNYKIAKDVNTEQGVSTIVDLPSLFLVNKRKKIIFKAKGYRPENIRSLERAIKQLQ